MRGVDLPPDDDADAFFQFDGADGSDADDAPEDAARPVPPRLGLLAELADDEFDVVARAAKLGFVPAGSEVFAQGAAADRFFILVDGSVEVVRDGEPLATLGPGAFFGESALLVGGRRSASVRTLTDSSIWSVSYEAFDHAVSHHLLADDAARAEAQRRIDATPPAAFEQRRGRA